MDVSYRLTNDPNVVVRLDSGTILLEGSPGWDAYLEWRAAGFLPEPVGGTRTLDQWKEALISTASAARWECETGGIEIDGVRVGTGLDDQNRLTGVLAAIQLGGLESVDFKAQNGWVKLSALQLQGIAQAISAHVQACFSAERAHHEAIALIDCVEEAETYDVSQDWPGTAG